MSSAWTSLHRRHDSENRGLAPPHLVADEKHCSHQGERIYWAVTAAKDCIVGSGLSPTAGYEDLQAAYGAFEREISDHAPDYRPETVTTDGWDATRRAWETLFPSITWILCFLHEVIKVRDWCRSTPDLRTCLTDKLWHIYHATNKRQFAQRLRRFLEWTQAVDLPNAIHERLQRLRQKSLFSRAPLTLLRPIAPVIRWTDL